MTERSRERYDRFFAEGGAPLPRWGEPEVVGRVVAALLAGELPYTVGQAVRVDGGATSGSVRAAAQSVAARA